MIGRVVRRLIRGRVGHAGDRALRHDVSRRVCVCRGRRAALQANLRLQEQLARAGTADAGAQGAVLSG